MRIPFSTKEWLRQRSLIYFESRSGLVFETGFLRHLLRLPYRAMHASARRLQQAFAEVDSFAAIADALDSLLSSPRLTAGGQPPLSKATVKKTVSNH
jgi:ABC-type bacteriocin/lantibiotic exporter with double-glycine peptidase domain